MKKLDQFILKTFIGPFIAILFVVVFILMMQFLWLYIDELVGKGLGFRVIIEFMGWGCATLLPLALPLATLLSSMMTMGNLGENNELLAIKAAGISLQRIMFPLTLVSILIAIGTFFAMNNLVPIAYNEIYTLRDDILRTKNEIKIPEGTFYDGIDGYILRIDDRDNETGMMHGVMVYDHTGDKGNVSLTIADSALMVMSPDKSFLTFSMYSGTNYEETNNRRYRDTTLQLQQIDFKLQEMVIPLENYAFKKSESGRFSDEVKTMPLEQLYVVKDSLTQLYDKMYETQMSEFRTGRRLRFNDQLDTANHREYKAMFAPEDLMVWKDTKEELSAYTNAISAANELQSTLEGYSRDAIQYIWVLRRADENILKKFAGALACFIFFFIGAPLGALIRKGGLGTPAIVSVLFFVLYWVVDVSGTKLARDGAVGSFTGAFISVIVLAPIGFFLTWKAINDSPLFNTDNFKAFFRKIKRKVMSIFHKTQIVYMGTPEFAVEPLDALIKHGYHISAVVTVPDKASGRGLKVNESAVKKYAVEHGIPVYQPEKLKDPEFVEAMKALKPDLFVVVAFRMLPKVIWEIPTLGTFNLHAALLPQYRGAAPINWAVINGDQVTGVTTFMIDEGIDTGNIMMREQIKIEKTDNAGDVHDKLMALGSRVVVQTVEGIIDGHIENRVQKSFIQGDEVLKPAPKLTRELCHIDWNGRSKDIHNLIRGLSPYPAAFTEICKEGTEPIQMKIYSSEIMNAEAVAALRTLSGIEGDGPIAPGTILCDGKSSLAITTANGAISVKELQISGKKRMDIKSFLLGFREPCSYKTTQGSSAEFIRRTHAPKE
ncbi:MAG: methionyl-tRNA formyltransferase [Bacteroidales bacterium]|nr:methionyl-tRNA formyltransferase [Candidatus Cryptobacteroides caccocaballi]